MPGADGAADGEPGYVKGTPAPYSRGGKASTRGSIRTISRPLDSVSADYVFLTSREPVHRSKAWRASMVYSSRLACLSLQQDMPKVIAFHGWDDPWVPPSDVVELGAEFAAAGLDWQLHAYGGTMRTSWPSLPIIRNGEYYTTHGQLAGPGSHCAGSWQRLSPRGLKIHHILG